MCDINTLLQQCNSGDSLQQIKAIDELVLLNAGETIPTLIDLLKSSDSVVRFSAVQALTEISTKDSDLIGNALINLLRDPESIVRAEAVDSLGIINYAPAVETVKFLLKNDSDGLVRASAAETLGDLGDITVIPDLELALSDADESVRSYAANSLGLLGNKSLLARLKKHLEKESSSRVTAEILGAIVRLGDPEALENLLTLLINADENLATCILNILTDLIDRKIPPILNANSDHISERLKNVVERFSILESHVDQIINKLKIS